MKSSRLYRKGHRKLQQEFESRPIADRLEGVNLHTEFTERERSFVESAQLFFLATADTTGQPNVSHKGGPRGFVRVVGPSELAYPDYDGNGMFMSLGNVLENPKVGVLFIDFEMPQRLVVRGRASVHREDPLMSKTVGAQLIVRVAVEAIYANCPRYIHKMKLEAESEYTPHAGKPPLEPTWKSFPEFRDAVHPRQVVTTEEDG